jgi:hypothetical protein
VFKAKPARKIIVWHSRSICHLGSTGVASIGSTGRTSDRYHNLLQPAVGRPWVSVSSNRMYEAPRRLRTGRRSESSDRSVASISSTG